MKPRVTGFRSDLNIPPVLLHDPLHSIQTESRPFPNSLGGEERFENVGLHLTRNPWTVIADLNYDAGILAISSDSKLAFSVHGVNRVINDVGPDLIEFAAK